MIPKHTKIGYVANTNYVNKINCTHCKLTATLDITLLLVANTTLNETTVTHLSLIDKYPVRQSVPKH